MVMPEEIDPDDFNDSPYAKTITPDHPYLAITPFSSVDIAKAISPSDKRA
jgi:hypothetical protein